MLTRSRVEQPPVSVQLSRGRPSRRPGRGPAEPIASCVGIATVIRSASLVTRGKSVKDVLDGIAAMPSRAFISVLSAVG